MQHGLQTILEDYNLQSMEDYDITPTMGEYSRIIDWLILWTIFFQSTRPMEWFLDLCFVWSILYPTVLEGNIYHHHHTLKMTFISDDE